MAGIRSLEAALSPENDTPLYRKILQRLTALETFIPPEEKNMSARVATQGETG